MRQWFSAAILSSTHRNWSAACRSLAWLWRSAYFFNSVYCPESRIFYLCLWRCLLSQRERFLTAHQHKTGHSMPFEVKIKAIWMFNVKSKGLQLIWDDDLVPLFCKALVETGQQHVARLIGYESLHTFIILRRIGFLLYLKCNFRSFILGWCHRMEGWGTGNQPSSIQHRFEQS